MSAVHQPAHTPNEYSKVAQVLSHSSTISTPPQFIVEEWESTGKTLERSLVVERQGAKAWCMPYGADGMARCFKHVCSCAKPVSPDTG